jgi:hypothetical protein
MRQPDQGTTIKKFADDTKIARKIESVNDAEPVVMQQVLDNMLE